VSYGEVQEDKYIRVTVVDVAVCLLCGCIIVMLFLLCYVFFVRLSILIVMYVPFWVLSHCIVVCSVWV
jgi:hypothetical protein